MQTFLPYPSFTASAAVLDYRRLGKQRVECYQIHRALTAGGGWAHHPAVTMWRGSVVALLQYGADMCFAWRARGYTDNMLPYFTEALARADRFAVSLLAAGQDAVSNYYAGWKQPGQTVELVRPEGGVPVVPDALAWIQCARHEAFDAGDHTLYLGRVEAATVRDGDPLLYFRGRYRALAE